MTTKFHITTMLTAVLLTAGLCARAQLAIDWHTIDGGGGTSAGGVYSVSGTLGQYDAVPAQMTGGSFSLAGGFWSIFAVQTPGAPYLMISHAGSGQVLISWSPDSPGWVLQQTESLTNSWSYAPSLSTNNVYVPTTQPMRFYRLFQP